MLHRTSTAAELVQASGGTSKPRTGNNEHYYASAVAQITVSSRGGSGAGSTTNTTLAPITKTKTIVGRHREACDIALEDSTTISAQHLAIYVMPSSLVFVEDLGSTNGSFLLTDPPMRLDPHVRMQWFDGRGAPSQHGIALGGSSAATVLTMSAVAFPSGRAIPNNVPPTLVENAEDDDDIPPPPALLGNFERRKSQQDVAEGAANDVAGGSAVSSTPAASAVCDTAEKGPRLDTVEDIEATLVYNGSLKVQLPPTSMGPAPPAAAAPTPARDASLGLAAFVASPPQPMAATSSSNTSLPTIDAPHSHSSIVSSGSAAAVALSPTPPPGLPNTLASTKSTVDASLGDEDESPPPPSSIVRRRAATSGSAQESVHHAETSPCPQTLDVSNLPEASPAKRALEYEDDEMAEAPRVAPTASPDAAASVPVAAASTGSVVKRHRAPSEEAPRIAERVESSPTQASLVSASLSSTKKRGSRVDHAAGMPVVLAEGGHAVLPLATPPSPPLPTPPPAAVERLYIPPLAAPAPAAPVVVPPTATRATETSSSGAPDPAAAGVAPLSASSTTARWQYKVDLRKANARDDAWEDYSATDAAIIELAHVAYQAAIVPGSKKRPKKALTEAKLNATYGIHFEDMVQFRFDDRSRQRPVRRVANH